jgi:NADH dehydrogenase
VTLVNDVNFMLYAPLLPGAAAGTLEPRHVVMPLRERLKRTELRLGWVTGGDPRKNQLEVELIAGHSVKFEYDQLVVALGSVSRTFPIPGLTEHAIGFKTIAEAIALRNRVVRHLETAEEIEDMEVRKQYLTFVFVGGGYAGIEGVAELEDLADDALEYYPRCRQAGMRWIVVEAAPQILPPNMAKLAGFTTKMLEKRGIEVLVETQLGRVTDTTVTLTGAHEETIPCRTVCWTAGVKASPVAARLGLPLDAGRISCNEEMRVVGYENVWALGDVAAVPDPARPGNPCPPTAQHAIRQGKLMGKNIAAALGHRAQVNDWTVDFWFRRDTAELGQLGHPPSLDTEPVTASLRAAPTVAEPIGDQTKA